METKVLGKRMKPPRVKAIFQKEGRKMQKKIYKIMILLFLAPAMCQATLTEWTSGDYEVGPGDTYDIIRILNNVTLSINDGGTVNELRTRDNTLTNMFGGTLGALIVAEESRVNLRGGNIDSVVSQSDQAVHIYGLEFEWAPEYDNPIRGVLTGLWEDATAFSINLRDCSPASGEVVLHVIPEPTSFLLFGISCLFLKKRK